MLSSIQGHHTDSVEPLKKVKQTVSLRWSPKSLVALDPQTNSLRSISRYRPFRIVITGFNTDIEHDGVTYHVQTEDKGLESPLILSLVYTGGAILASKRSRYEDLIAAGFDEDKLAQRLKRQHRLICAAINAGRIEDLKRMGRAEEKDEPAPSLAPPPVADDPTLETKAPRTAVSATEEAPAEPTLPPPSVASEPSDIQSLLVSNASDFEAMVEATPPQPQPAPPLPDEPLPPPLEVTAPPRGTESSVYTVHDSRRGLPIRNAGKVEQGVVVTILDEEEFRAGQIFNIRVMVENRTGTTGKPIAGVALSIKILGTTFRPQLYSVKTGRDGVAVVSAQIPLFTSGRAAILIQANAEGKSVEMRRVIHAAL